VALLALRGRVWVVNDTASKLSTVKNPLWTTKLSGSEGRFSFSSFGGTSRGAVALADSSGRHTLDEVRG
jgi:hypothetical protein